MKRFQRPGTTPGGKQDAPRNCLQLCTTPTRARRFSGTRPTAPRASIVMNCDAGCDSSKRVGAPGRSPGELKWFPRTGRRGRRLRCCVPMDPAESGSPPHGGGGQTLVRKQLQPGMPPKKNTPCNKFLREVSITTLRAAPRTEIRSGWRLGLAELFPTMGHRTS